MKRKMIAIGLLLLLPLLLPGAATAREPAGKVVRVRGTALLERSGSEKALKARAELLENDSVRTRQRSRLKMLFRNDSIMTIGSNSRLVIKQYLQDGSTRRAESVFELADGKMRAVVGAGSFKVLTPTAYAAARGTVFVIWFDAASNTTGIAVIEGGLEIRNIRHSVERGIILTAGQMSLIAGNDGPSPPEPFSLDLWNSGAEGSHWSEILQELADLGEPANDETVVEIDPADLPVPPEGGGGAGQSGGQGGTGGTGGTGETGGTGGTGGTGETGGTGGTGGTGETGGTNGLDDLPPLIEPPIDQQPPPPAPIQVPITVNPVFP